ncbi:hypothetical protein L596_014412 [Steinernema carpocapsae]|uniref:Elongation of very long chain fatty acids protein n=1 Tax=Steinernema carpocapsae TaxID=34508 RepID=A0A4U5NCS6_STECR|nr:hypothetical protein L596_014412 [Steinernema carpocapsae]
MPSKEVVGFDDQAAAQWVHSHRAHMILLEIAYVVTVINGAEFFKRRLAHVDTVILNKGNLIWNGFNAFASGVLFLCLLPEFLYSLLFTGFYGSICETRNLYTGRLSGWAIFMFTLSKAWELGDTVWLLARQRPVSSLHFYHHVAVLFEVWISYRSAGSIARWGIIMNLGLHTVMYSYFVAQTLDRNARRMASFITMAQIVQFAISILMLFRVCYSVERSMQLSVNAQVLDVETGDCETTNTFQFTFTADKEVPIVTPRTYADGMLYLEAKRHFDVSKW